MLSKSVPKTLFRSLLRWNRRPEIIASKFTIDTDSIGVRHRLPQSILSGHEGVQAAVFHCFRTYKATDENIDLCFAALKEMNNLKPVLQERLDLRARHMRDDINDKVVFKIGQVVRYKKLKFRGVVTGWDVDEATGKQQLEVLFDSVDKNENEDTRQVVQQFTDSSHFTLIEDRCQTRIFNAQLNAYFNGYNVALNRYIPNDDILFTYPRDFEGVTVPENTALKEDLRQSSLAAKKTVKAIGGKLEGIFDKYVTPEEYQTMLADLQDGGLLKRESFEPLSAVKTTIMRQVLDEVIGTTKLCCDDTASLSEADNQIRVTADASGRATDAETGEQSDDAMFQRLRRGGALRKEYEAMMKANAASSMAYLRFQNDALNAQMSGSYKALLSLTKCYNTLDQLLQLRFQHKGIAYLEGLAVSGAEDAAIDTRLIETSSEDDSGSSGSASKSVHVMNYDTSQPPAHFEVGQVVRHRQYGYRGVISGYDQKPLVNVSGWEAVAKLPQGQEQPFYKVIPDMRDVDRIFNGEYRSHFYAAQDNLELVTDKDERLLSHKTLRYYFLGFDDATQRYIPKHKLSYCMRTASSEPPGAVAAETYDAIDKILVECYTLVRESFSASRRDFTAACRAAAAAAPAVTGGTVVESSISGGKDAAVLDVSDLLLHMKHAVTREDALTVESMLWLVWMAHSNPEVNKAMRLGVSNSKRGNSSAAIDAYTIATTLDPTFSEAHNKLAALHHQLREHDNCLQRASLALSLFPHHFGALSGMALAYERMGQIEPSIVKIRQALDIHPWASNLPTILMAHDRHTGPRERYIDRKATLRHQRREHSFRRSATAQSTGFREGDTTEEDATDGEEFASTATEPVDGAEDEDAIVGRGLDNVNDSDSRDSASGESVEDKTKDA